MEIVLYLYCLYRARYGRQVRFHGLFPVQAFTKQMSKGKIRSEIVFSFCLFGCCMPPPKKKSEKWQFHVPYCGNPFLRRIKDDSPFEGKYSCFSTTTEFEHFLERQSRLITWLLLASAPPPPPTAPLTPSPFRLSAVSRLER